MSNHTSEHAHGADQNVRGSYALVNGLNVYYEIEGTGRPLIVLHGGFGSTEMYAPSLPGLAETHQVIRVDLQGHGRTADIARPLRYDLMADDIALLIEHLGLEKADIIGYSLGGGVGLQTAIRHPERVRKLVILSTVYKSDGWYPESRANMASMTVEGMSATILHDVYRQTAPKPKDWPTLVTKMKHLLSDDPYDWTDSVAALKVPTLIIVGDADSVSLAHAVEMFGLLGGGKADGLMGNRSTSQLAVLPGVIHIDILDHTDALIPIVVPFLDAPIPTEK